MKIFLVGLLFLTSTITFDAPLCVDLKFEVNVTHTSQGLDNGKIEVTLITSTSKVKAFLYGDKKSKNRLDVNTDQLTNLSSGSYILILQDKKCATVKRDIIIK